MTTAGVKKCRYPARERNIQLVMYYPMILGLQLTLFRRSWFLLYLIHYSFLVASVERKFISQHAHV